MATYVLKWDDIEPLLEGLAILGTGGGGSSEWGRAILETDFREGREIRIIDPMQVEDEALVVCGGIMGSVKTLESMSIVETIKMWEEYFPLLVASQVMERFLGKNVDYVVPFEVGGLNTPVILSLAARRGICTVDGDALGRSAPETQMTSFITHGVSLVPMPLVDSLGNAIVVADQSQSVFADEIGRWMITRGGGMGANNHYPMTGAQLKAAVIPNTITLAIQVGRNLLVARQQGGDPVASVVSSLNGFELFRGIVESIEGEDCGGFYITNVGLSGVGCFEGRQAKMVIKNETMVCWVDGQLKAVFPDLVCMLDPNTGKGIMSVDVTPAMELVLVGAPCHRRLREGLATEIGAIAFGGARFGHPEIKYAPLEVLNCGGSTA